MIYAILVSRNRPVALVEPGGFFHRTWVVASPDCVGPTIMYL